MYKKYTRLGLRYYESLRGYLIGMMIEGAATLVLMSIGLLISIAGFYLWK